MQALRYLSRADVERVDLSMREIITALEKMFQEKGAGRVEMPPKPGIHTRKDAFIHAMPAYIPALEAAGLKWISGYPGNQARNLPYISGLLILNDPETGVPLAIMDATWITAQRTGAATAVAAKYLARTDSSAVGILACGVQGRSNLEALACLFSFDRVKAYDLNPEIARKFAAEMAVVIDAEIEVVTHPKEAVRQMDIIVTSGPILKAPDPVIVDDWVSEGAFGCPVDFDSYWQEGALAGADKLATDDKMQMTYYRREGYFHHTPEPYADLGEIVAGKQPGRERQEERIIAVNLGLALEDMAVAARIYRQAQEMGLGRMLPL